MPSQNGGGWQLFKSTLSLIYQFLFVGSALGGIATAVIAYSGSINKELGIILKLFINDEYYNNIYEYRYFLFFSFVFVFISYIIFGNYPVDVPPR